MADPVSYIEGPGDDLVRARTLSPRTFGSVLDLAERESYATVHTPPPDPATANAFRGTIDGAPLKGQRPGEHSVLTRRADVLGAARRIVAEAEGTTRRAMESMAGIGCAAHFRDPEGRGLGPSFRR